MNPKIDWLDFGKPAFDKSLKEGKPILLSIYSTWSRACRLMDGETYSLEEVAAVVNKNYIPVRVNSDERPDINARYNQGGFPSTVFLTSRGQIITGATYVATGEFLDLLDQIFGIYESLKRSGRDLGESTEGQPLASPEEKRIYYIKYHVPFVSRFEELLLNTFDPLYGGFGQPAGGFGPKFPLPDVLDFLLKSFKKTGDFRLRSILEKTLEGMADGGLFDHLDGGFFNYAKDRTWRSTYSEKLLENNIHLARIYYDAGKLLEDRRFVEISKKTVNFINQWLYNRDRGGFYASVSADDEYYKLASRSERLAYLGEHKSPQADTTIYTNLNAMAADLYFGLGDKEFSAAALNLLLNSFRCPDGLFFHYKKGETGNFPEFLTDQLYLVKCLANPVLNSSAFALTLKPKTLAESVWRLVLDNFYDYQNGGFFDRKKIPEGEVGLLKKSVKNIKENAESVRILKWLGYTKEAQTTLAELLWQNKVPTLNSGPLACLLLENL